MNWNLDALYTSFDSKEFKEDFNTLSSLTDTLEKWSSTIVENPNTQEVLESYIDLSIQTEMLTSKLYSFSSLTFATDTTNTAAVNQMEKIQKIDNTFTGPMVVFKEYLKGLSTDELNATLEKSNKLKDHAFHLHALKKQTNYMLTKKEEVLLAKMKEIGSGAWSTLQSQLSSGLMVDIELEGKPSKLPMSVVRNLAFDADKNTRKIAYEAELKAYEKTERSSAAALNAIKGQVLIESELRGFQSPLDKTLFDSRLSRESLDAMLDAIKAYLPTFRAYYRRKAALLGYTEGLPFYELFAPMNATEKKIPFEEGKQIVLDNFYSFSQQLGDYAKKAFDHNWIDVYPKEGKRGGAFCSNLAPIKESRFLLNYSDSLKNVITTAHELGHGFHGENIFNESILNCHYTMPVAETASIFCETIVKKSLIENATDEEKVGILEGSIIGYGQTIVDIYSRFLFESELFKRREDASVSIEDIKAMMLDAQEAAYGDGLDPNIRHPYMWMNKVHYYYASRNFYNFPYAFGLLFAKGLYSKYQQLGDAFVPKYNALLQATGKMSIEDVALLMDIDITQKEFWMSSLEVVASEINEFLALTQ